MRTLSNTELMEVNGGIAPLVVAGLIVGGIFLVGLGVGIYNGYQSTK